MKKKAKKRAVAGVVLDADVISYLDVLGEREDRSRSWLINTIVREHAQQSGQIKLNTKK